MWTTTILLRLIGAKLFGQLGHTGSRKYHNNSFRLLSLAMKTESNVTKIEKLNQNNYYSWKQKIFLVLSLRDLDEQIDSIRPESEEQALIWDKKDRKAKAIIGLSLSDQILENVRHVTTASSMWITIKNIFERHTLLNKLSARRKFYSAIKLEQETILQFSNRIIHLATNLKSMGVTVEDSEMAMALLNGLPDPYDPLISALDALGTEEDDLEFEHVKSRVLQEEQRISMRISEASSKSETGALISTCQGKCATCNVAAYTGRPTCTFCGKLGHLQEKCWKKYPHLNPHKKNQTDHRPALMVDHSEEESDVICLVGEHLDASKPSTNNHWYIDSGCSNHMTYDRRLFSTLVKSSVSEVELGNGNKADIIGCGIIHINILSNGNNRLCKLKNVFLVPELGYQLLSVSSMSRDGLTTTFKDGRCFIDSRGSIVASGTLCGTLYKLDVPGESHSQALLSSTMQVWHERLAHVDPSTILSMAKSKTITGISIQKSTTDSLPCDGCVRGKAHRTPIPKTTSSRSTKLLELIHSDVNGPLEIPSLGGSRYFITFVDDFSRWIVVHTMKKKSDSLSMFKKYHMYAQVHTGNKVGKVNFIKCSQKSSKEIKSIRTDNGGEYISNAFNEYLSAHGISHQLTVAYTPQQNGVAERMNRTLIDLVRSMLHSSNIEKVFWAEALGTAVYVRNRVTSRSLPTGKTPYHLWNGSTPDVSHLRIFGSDCFYTVPKTKTKKLDARARPAMFVGYSTMSKGYKLWDRASNKMIVSRDVTFRELERKGSDVVGFPNEEEINNRGGDVKVQFDDLSSSDSDGTEIVNSPEEEHESSNTESDAEGDGEAPTPKSLRRSFRKFTKTKPFWEKQSSFSVTALSAIALSAQIVPLSYKEATSSANIGFWKPGIDSEHESLLRNNTWTIVDRHPNMHVLPSKYVFRVKNGAPKARMVVLGCKQIYGLDYYHTFAPVVKFTTIRTLMAIVAAQDLECEQMDVVTAFLNGDLEEEIFMNIPEGLRTPENQNCVCKLNKALYGLKQAPRQWYAKIDDYLVRDLDFTSSMNDPCLYIKKTSSIILIVAIYVDDLLIIGNSKPHNDEVKKEFKKRFDMKDLGPVDVMLGMEITRDRQNRKLHISQKQYTKHILERFGMDRSNPICTPIERAFSKVSEYSTSDLAQNVPYRQAVGSLIYLVTATRPDIAFSVSQLSKFLENPLDIHWIGVKRIFRYLAGTQSHGILFDGKSEIELKGYSDSDYAGCTEGRKSTSGYIFLLAGGAISWKSKKQTVTATSTCEAEYMALCYASKEAVWLSRLVADIQCHNSPSPISIRVDNDGTIDLSTNASINERSKHIDVQYHFVRECVKLGKINLIHCSTANQLADPLTKALERVKHERFRLLQGVVSNS